MSCLVPLLAPTARDVEKRLRPLMTGLFGSFLQPYLPQVWVFRTEEETVTLRVGADGNCSVAPGAGDEPCDVRIETSHSRLVGALRRRGPQNIPDGPLEIRFDSKKGEKAF